MPHEVEDVGAQHRLAARPDDHEWRQGVDDAAALVRGQLVGVTYVRGSRAAVPALERALPRYLPREHAWDGEWNLVLSILSVRHGRIIPKPDDGGK